MGIWGSLKSIVRFEPIAPAGGASLAGLAAPVPAEVLEIAAQLVPNWQIGRPAWPEWDARKAGDGARKLALVFRCLSVLAYTVGTAPVRVYDEANGQTVAGHPMRRLMRRPNPHMGEAAFWGHVGLRTATYGFCVVEKERSRLGDVIALWPLRSAWLKAKPRRDSSVDWEYRVPGIAAPYQLAAENVIVFRWADTSEGSPYGAGPLEASFREIALLNQLMDFVKGYVDRGAVPVWGIVPEMQIGDATVKPKTQAEIDALLDSFVARHGGLDKASRPIYLQAIKELVKIGSNLEEMAFQALRDVSELAICTAFGVPPRKVGVRAGLEHSTQNATAQVEDAEFYNGTVVPLWSRFDDALTLGLLSEFEDPGSTISLEFDTSKIRALQEDRNAKIAALTPLFLGGGIPASVFCAETGLPAPAADFYLRGIATEAVPATDPIGGAAGGDTAALRGLARVRGPLALPATLAGDGPARRLAAATNGRKLIRRVADAREPSIRAFFRDQGKRLIPKVTEGLGTAGGPVETLVAAAIDWDAEEWALEPVLKRLYQLAGETAYGAVNDELGTELAFDLANPHLDEVRGHFAQEIKGVTAESRSQIQAAVTKGLKEGASPDEIAARLTDLFEGWATHRAKTVALTAGAYAYNSASAIGYRESGVVDRCQLFDNASHDTDPQGPTNTTCADRDGMIVPLDDVDDYIASMHPNCIMAVAPVLKGEE